MKNIASALLISTAMTNTAIAGNIDSPVIEVVPPIAAAATDWSGFYGGLQAAMGTGDALWMFLGRPSRRGAQDSEGFVYGGFAGYNSQHGNMVFGGELSYMAGTIGAIDEQEPDWYTYNSILDAKARVGFAAGSALVYGAAGYSSVNLSEDGFAPDSADLSGFGYGAGVDFKISENMFFGAEYFTRNVEGPLTYVGDGDYEVEGHVTTITARIGMSF